MSRRYSAAPATVSFAVVLLIVIAAIGLASTVQVGSRAEPQSSSTSTETVSSVLGLRLTLSVNSTTILSQDAINITALVTNTLPTANNLTASNGWAIDGLSAGPCDPGNTTNKLYFPVAIGIFRGTYGLDNVSGAAQPLFVWAAVSCPADYAFKGNQSYPLTSITSYSILPGNDNGTYVGNYIVSFSPQTLAKGVFPIQTVDEAAIYAANGTGFYDSLRSSLPANYTLVAGDEWGQLTLLHFSVVASNNLPQVGNFLADSGGCAEGSNPVPCVTFEFSQAFIFNCAAQAAEASGCTTQVPSSGPWGTSYPITVWYPYTGEPGEPTGQNCKFMVPGDTVSPYAYCFKVNATAFALSP